ncbi:MAG: radical SAM protein [Kiritimatiellaeota bacterium]|nr:radical SAM protein [Kiritimatiellota bacterium]
MRILLLNPPGTRPYLRDYYCASLAKTDYSYPPMDLVMLTGRLTPFAEVRFIDAMARRIPPEQTAAAVRDWDPDVIVSLTSSLSLFEDMDFLASIEKPGRLLIVTGDIFRDLAPTLLDLFPFLDAALNDFTEPAIVEYLRGRRAAPLPNLVFRDTAGRILEGPAVQKSGDFSFPLPRWDLVPLSVYNFPFVRHLPFASVLTDFGCPFACSFCPIGAIPWKTRLVSEVRAELEALRKAGVREIHFRDQTFGLPADRLEALCAVTGRLGFAWSCFSRVDVLRPETVRLMRDTGCHTVIFGVETAGEERRRTFRKSTTDAAARIAIEACRKCGVRTVGTFILGLPGDDEDRVRATIRHARDLGLDYASFNVAMPRFGTELRRRDLPSPRDRSALASLLEDRAGFVAFETALAWVRRANRAFYLHPRTWFNHLAALRSWGDLRRELAMGKKLLFGGRR